METKADGDNQEVLPIFKVLKSNFTKIYYYLIIFTIIYGKIYNHVYQSMYVSIIHEKKKIKIV